MQENHEAQIVPEAAASEQTQKDSPQTSVSENCDGVSADCREADFEEDFLEEDYNEEEYMDDDNNVMVCISKLRAKLSNDGSKYIKTVRGLGYRLEK